MPSLVRFTGGPPRRGVTNPKEKKRESGKGGAAKEIVIATQGRPSGKDPYACEREKGERERVSVRAVERKGGGKGEKGEKVGCSGLHTGLNTKRALRVERRNGNAMT